MGPAQAWIEPWFKPWTDPLQQAADALGHTLSPYQLNPLNLNPLRDILVDTVDFDRARRAGPSQGLVGSNGIVGRRAMHDGRTQRGGLERVLAAQRHALGRQQPPEEARLGVEVVVEAGVVIQVVLGEVGEGRRRRRHRPGGAGHGAVRAEPEPPVDD